MREDEAQELRRQRLRAWIQDHGGLARVAADRRLKPSYASYLSQICNGYSIASRGARTCESRLGMPDGWLDQATIDPHDETPAPAPMPPTLTQALEVLGLALAVDLADDVRDDIADALRKLAQRRGAARDQAQVLQLLNGASGKPQHAAA